MPPCSSLFRLAFLGLLVALGAGCARRPVPVEGVMRWDDGKPLAFTSLRFIPVDGKGRESCAMTSKEGEFSLSTFNSDDGTFPGEYKVVVTKFSSDGTGGRPPAIKAGNDAEMAKAMKDWWEGQLAKQQKVVDPVPAVYSDEKTTPLRATIDSGGGKVELKLKRT